MYFFLFFVVAESMQVEPIGIIGGNNYQMGNFEECIKTSAHGVRGQYCLANFQYAVSQEQWQRYQKSILPSDFRDMIHEESVWQGLVRVSLKEGHGDNYVISPGMIDVVRLFVS